SLACKPDLAGWRFSWTAPKEGGPVTIYASAVLGDGDGHITNDRVATIAKEMPPPKAPSGCAVGPGLLPLLALLLLASNRGNLGAHAGVRAGSLTKTSELAPAQIPAPAYPVAGFTVEIFPLRLADLPGDLFTSADYERGYVLGSATPSLPFRAD